MSERKDDAPAGSSPDDDGPLAFYTDEQLWEEIYRRYDTALFVGERIQDKKRCFVRFDYKGSTIQALGMGQYAMIIAAQRARDLKPPPGGSHEDL